ncbi:MAG: Holo-[acyl-carrier-protein] synthase, partial [Chlamydiae bacterium]|nr:Holo-[acyl-carrier-protein] synthase [Chlamydiota bacterium]
MKWHHLFPIFPKKGLRGVGTDIIEVSRIRIALERHGDRFLERIFTEKERAYSKRASDPIPHLAGRFAAKEAIVKALGTGIGKEVSWQEVEILNDPLGKPEVYLSPRLQKLFCGRFLLS